MGCWQLQEGFGRARWAVASCRKVSGVPDGLLQVAESFRACPMGCCADEMALWAMFFSLLAGWSGVGIGSRSRAAAAGGGVFVVIDQAIELRDGLAVEGAGCECGMGGEVRGEFVPFFQGGGAEGDDLAGIPGHFLGS